MGNGVGQLGPIKRVKVKLIDTVGLQYTHLFRRHDRCHEAPKLRIIFCAFKHMAQPDRDVCSAHGRELRRLGVVGYRHDPRHDRCRDTGGKAALEKTKISCRIKKILSDGAGGAGIKLTLEVVQIVAWAESARMRLRIGRNRNLEIGNVFQAGNEVGGIGVATGMRIYSVPGGGSPRSATMWRMPAVQ